MPTLHALLSEMVQVSRDTGQPVHRTAARGLRLKVLARQSVMVIVWRDGGKVPSNKECEIVGEDAGMYDPRTEPWTCRESQSARLIREGFTGALCDHQWGQPVHFNMRPRFAWQFSCEKCGCRFEIHGSTRSKKQTYTYDEWELRESVAERWKQRGPVPGSLKAQAHHQQKDKEIEV